MQIEVPRDQYNEAIRIMQKRIDLGQVPNVQPGEDARNYVRKGYFTYAQSFNICKAGTIESLSIDATSGAIYSSLPGGITATISFATAIWNGNDLQESAKIGITAGMKTIGRGAFIYTFTMQLSRKQFANPFIKEYTTDGIYKGLAGIDNPIYKISNNIANKISSSDLANTSIGHALGLPSVTERLVLSGIGITLMMFGPDICRALSGKISTQQLVKNSVISASALAGCHIGQALIPIPILGSVIGGAVGGFVAKNILDQFVEDDAIEMFQILKEEFIDIVMQSYLTNVEFEKVAQITICSSDVGELLRQMYASGEYRTFAREAIVTNVLSSAS